MLCVYKGAIRDSSPAAVIGILVSIVHAIKCLLLPRKHHPDVYILYRNFQTNLLSFFVVSVLLTIPSYVYLYR